MSNVRASRPVLTGRFAALAVRLGLLSVLWVTLVEGHPEVRVARVFGLPPPPRGLS
jgi:hypothetical protein